MMSVFKKEEREMDIYGRPLCIPKRKSSGTSGRQIKVEVNYFALNLEGLFKKTVYRLEVKFSPNKPISLYRAALEKFNKLYYNNINFAFDGRKNMYTANYVSDKTGYVTIFNDECRAQMTFCISTSVTAMPMGILKKYFSSGSLDNDLNDALQALNIILKNQPISMGYIGSGKTLFPKFPKAVDETDNLILREGIYQRLHVGWKPYLNIDVVNKVCRKNLPMLLFIKHELQSDLKTQLSFKTLKALSFIVGGLKMYSMVGQNIETPRYLTVNGLFNNASHVTVEWNRNTEAYRYIVNSEFLTVVEYFKIAYNYTVVYPHLPCLHVGNIDESWCVPIELCYVLNDEMVPKSLSKLRFEEMQSSPSLKKPIVLVDLCKIIAKHLTNINYNEGLLLKDLAITIDQKFTSLNARVLSQPTILYAGNKITYPKSGVWNVDKCVKGAIITECIVLNLDEYIKIGYIKCFEQKFIYYSKRVDILVKKFSYIFDLFINKNKPVDVIEHQISEFFTYQSKKVQGLQLIIVILPEHPTADLYGIIKQISELETGILTQCIRSKNFKKILNSKTTITNILLKINAKLNGINHIVAAEDGMDGAMILGAVNRNQASTALKIPSIAAVVTSQNLTGSQYNMEWCFQPPNTQTITDLDNIIYKQLLKFQNETKTLPKKLIYLRQSAINDDLKHFLKTELIKIQQACKKINKFYKPAITFVIVQKQKHTRIFHKNDADMKPDSLVGTVIDTQITHPTERSFFLCSHYNNQSGTSKPTKYHVIWDDSNFTEDQLQRIMLNTCYMLAPSTKSTIYPAPMHYARMAVNRIRGYLKFKHIDLDRLHEEQEKMKQKQFISTSNPMFFI